MTAPTPPRIHRDALCWPSVQAYALGRIEELRDELEHAAIDRVPGLQAAITELRSLVASADDEREAEAEARIY